MTTLNTGNQHMRRSSGRRAFGARLTLVAAALLLPLTGCTSLLDDLVGVKLRDQIDPKALETAAGAKALYNGAINNISVSFSGNNGGTEGISTMGGTMADEWFHSGTFSTRESYDRRGEDVFNGTVGGIFRALHNARQAAIRAHTALALLPTASTDPRIAEMKAIEGLTFILGAETFCNGAPFTDLEGSTITGGAPITNAEAFNQAITRLDAALAGAPGTGNNIANLTRVLKARALMNLGKSRFNEAAALLASVPTTFKYLAFHSASGNRNGIFVFNTQNERFSLSHNEGTNGLPFRGTSADGSNPALADPRIPFQRDPGNGWGFDGVGRYPQWNARKWTSFDDEAIIASGVEARLMEAEALLASGGDWLGKLNTLRQTVTGLAPLVDPGTAIARENMVFSEKGFWLFGEAHRLGDLRRLIRQYGRSEASVFPVGAYHKGGSYASDVNFPINDVEQNNKEYAKAKADGLLNVRGCLDDSA